MENNSLKILFDNFIKVFPQEVHTSRVTGEPFGTFPFYLDIMHPHYEGYEAIIVGDDTEISEYGAGLFKVLDYHHEEDVQILNLSEVIDYYCGMHVAYHLSLCEDKTLAFRKGYKKILKQLIEMIDDTNEQKPKFNPNNN